MAINKNKVIAAAQKFVQKGQLDKAIREYRKVVEVEPEDVRTWLKIGDLQAKKGSMEEAVGTYARVANHYSEQGFYLKAVAVFKQVLKLQPRNVEVHLKLAELYQQLGLNTDARRQLESAYKVLSDEGRVEDSLKVLRAMVDLDPDNVPVRIRLGETYSREKMTEQAVQEFTRAADILRSAGRIDDFIRVAERLVWHQPDNSIMNKELATLYIRRQDPRRALQKLQLCYQADEKDTETLNLLVAAFIELDQRSKAVTILKVLANIHEEKGEPEHRDDVYRRVLELDPNDEEALGALDRLQPGAAVQEGLVEAEEALDEVPEAAVEELDVEELEEIGELEEISELEEVEELDGLVELGEEDTRAEQVATLYGEAEVYEKFGLLKEAVDQLETARELDPSNEETYLRLKTLYVKMGDIDSATAALHFVASRLQGPDPAEAEALLREITTLDPGDQRAWELLGEEAPVGEDAEPSVSRRLREEPEATPWTEAESDVRILEDIAEEAYTDQPYFATEEIDIDDLERQLDLGQGPGRGVTFQPIATEPDRKSSREVDLEDELAALELADAGLEYLEEELDAVDSLVNVEASFLDPLITEPAARPDASVGVRRGAESELEVDLERLRDGLGEPTGPDRAEDELSIDLGFEFGEEPERRKRRTRDTAVVPREEVERLAGDRSSDAEDEELRLERTPSGSSAIEDVFEDELRQLEEAEELVASLHRDGQPVEPGREGERAQAYEMEDAFSDLAEPAMTDLEETPVEGVDVFEEAQDEADEGSAAELDLATARAALEEPEVDEDDPQVALIRDEMEEADFFINQGLYEDAIQMLRDLIQEHGEHPLLMRRIEQVKAMLTDEGDLDELLQEEEQPEQPARRLAIPRGEADAFSQFKEGVARQVGEDDAETHFDVGIAYKEMGMVSDAINEFQAAMRPHNEVQCHMMIAVCYREQGDLSEAINEYKKSLYCEQITEVEQTDIYFQMGTAYEDLCDPKEAIYYFEKVNRLAGGYRDVRARLERLHGEVEEGKNPSQRQVDSAFDELVGGPPPGANGDG